MTLLVGMIKQYVLPPNICKQLLNHEFSCVGNAAALLYKVQVLLEEYLPLLHTAKIESIDPESSAPLETPFEPTDKAPRVATFQRFPLEIATKIVSFANIGDLDDLFLCARRNSRRFGLGLLRLRGLDLGNSILHVPESIGIVWEEITDPATTNNYEDMEDRNTAILNILRGTLSVARPHIMFSSCG